MVQVRALSLCTAAAAAGNGRDGADTSQKVALSADLMDLRLQVQQLSSAVSTQQQQVQSQMLTIQQLKAQLELQGELAAGRLPPDLILSACLHAIPGSNHAKTADEYQSSCCKSSLCMLLCFVLGSAAVKHHVHCCWVYITPC